MFDITKSPILGILQRAIRADQPESPKAVILFMSALCMCLVCFAVGMAITVRIAANQPLDWGTVTFAAGLFLTLGGLAGFHNQKDPVIPPAPSKEGEV